MARLTGKVAIVTGAAMGIGKATAALMAREGAAVMLADVDEAAGNATLAEIQAAGGRAAFCRTDVANTAAMTAMVAATEEAFGGVDILVNNAARALQGAVVDLDEDRWNEILNTNLTSVWRGMKLVIPGMITRGGGAIVNVSSVQSLLGFHGWAGYAAAKGGINALTQQAAVEYAPHKIRINAVAPGTIMTPLNEKVFREAADPQKLIDTWNSIHPIGRFGEADEVAELILFLASDAASFITGELVRVDGGLAVKGD